MTVCRLEGERGEQDSRNNRLRPEKAPLKCFRTRVQLPPAPPNNDPDTSGEVQKARMAQALRAFLYLLLSENIRLNPVIIGIRLGIR